MTNTQEVPVQVDQIVAPDAALAGAGKATKNVASSPRPDPEVAAVAHRRQFNSRDKRRILEAADPLYATG